MRNARARTTINVLALAGSLFLAATTLAADNPAKLRVAKQAWELTVDERIALRTNRDLAQERVRGGARMQTSNAPALKALGPVVDAFDGKTHPELFLPVEVFDQLVELAFLSSPRTGQAVREGFMPEVKRHGLPDDFWQRLQSVSTVYSADYWAVRDTLTSVRNRSGRARQRAEETLTLKNRDACRSRAEAFAAARKEFGRERFDRFLYDVVAVGMFEATDRLPDSQLLRQAEEGCR